MLETLWRNTGIAQLSFGGGQLVMIGIALLLLILEAMKMEAEIKAPQTGRVLNVFVSEGDKVAAGDPLMELG